MEIRYFELSANKLDEKRFSIDLLNISGNISQYQIKQTWSETRLKWMTFSESGFNVTLNLMLVGVFSIWINFETKLPEVTIVIPNLVLLDPVTPDIVTPT